MRLRPYHLWLLLPVLTALTLLTLGALQGPTGEQRQMIQDIDEGSVLAWGEHITGQDPNDLTSWDEFESVAVIPGRSARANGDTRLDDEVWTVVNREVNGVSVRYIEQFQPLDWGDDPNYCWFVDCAGVDQNLPDTPATPATPAVPGTYGFTYFSEQGYIYGIALGDAEATCFLNAGGAARNAGGGLVGLPFTGHPFAVGDPIVITRTSFYQEAYTVAAGTTANEILITADYAAETFAGDEAAIKKITLGIAASLGRAQRDSSGNFYYGHTRSAGSCITRRNTDGTEESDLFDWTGAGLGSGSGGQSLVMDAAEEHLYVLLDSPSTVVKFNLADGTSDWIQTTPASGYELALDASGNVYTYCAVGLLDKVVGKLATADGSVTLLTDMGEGINSHIGGNINYEVIVDDDQGIVLAGGQMYTFADEPQNIALMYNLGVRTLDDSAGDTIRVGDTYTVSTLEYTQIIGSGHIAVYDGYIYVLVMPSASTSTIHKLQWNGAAVAEITSWAGPSYACGIFVDLYGNIGIVNQQASGVQTDTLYWYDTDGNALGNVTGFPGGLLADWNSGAGGSWKQGDVMPDGDLGTPEVPGTPATPNHSYVGSQLDGEQVCVYADAVPRGTFTMDGNDIQDFNEADYAVVIAGLNYYSIFETMPLRQPVTLGRQSTIQTVQVNFHDSMGAHVGADMEHSADWVFYPKRHLEGAARNIGGGVVGLPYTGQPFAAGDVVYVYGTTNYDGLHTLAADSNGVELRITAAYTAESFDRTELVLDNTPFEPWSGYKGPAPFLRGTTRKPSVYLWIWDPVPMTIRSITGNLEVTFE